MQKNAEERGETVTLVADATRAALICRIPAAFQGTLMPSEVAFRAGRAHRRWVKKIRVIDDHEPMRRYVLMILELEGFKAVG